MNQRTGHAGGKWRPAGLPQAVTDEDLTRYVYAVVEERIDEILELIVTPWPQADGERPVFAGSEEEYALAVTDADLHQALAQRHIASPAPLTVQQLPEASEELRQRQIEVGDAFAVPASLEAVARAAEGEGPGQVDTWIEGRVIDVTADAREAAKLATLRAVAPPLDPKVERRLLTDADADQAGEPAGH